VVVQVGAVKIYVGALKVVQEREGENRLKLSLPPKKMVHKTLLLHLLHSTSLYFSAKILLHQVLVKQNSNKQRKQMN
jgi:hypothetical protein